jgi:small subunit ribosomal protein S17
METVERNQRKVVKGKVVSNKMDKTLVVQIERTLPHPRYGKVISVDKRVYAHTDKDSHQIGDVVTIMETRPLSKTKRWRVVEENTN